LKWTKIWHMGAWWHDKWRWPRVYHPQRQHHDSNHNHKSSDLSHHVILHDWLHPGLRTSPTMVTDYRGSHRYLWNQTVRKNMVVHDRIPSDSTISKHESSNGVHRWSLPELDIPARSIKTMQQVDLYLDVRGFLGLPPYYLGWAGSPHATSQLRRRRQILSLIKHVWVGGHHAWYRGFVKKSMSYQLYTCQKWHSFVTTSTTIILCGTCFAVGIVSWALNGNDDLHSLEYACTCLHRQITIYMVLYDRNQWMVLWEHTPV
jgi:hypothetical protein